MEAAEITDVQSLDPSLVPWTNQRKGNITKPFQSQQCLETPCSCQVNVQTQAAHLWPEFFHEGATGCPVAHPWWNVKTSTNTEHLLEHFSRSFNQKTSGKGVLPFSFPTKPMGAQEKHFALRQNWKSSKLCVRICMEEATSYISRPEQSTAKTLPASSHFGHMESKPCHQVLSCVKLQALFLYLIGFTTIRTGWKHVWNPKLNF